jgi:hypothetical protein
MRRGRGICCSRTEHFASSSYRRAEVGAGRTIWGSSGEGIALLEGDVRLLMVVMVSMLAVWGGVKSSCSIGFGGGGSCECCLYFTMRTGTTWFEEVTTCI